MSIGTVSVDWPDDMYCVTTKSSIESAKTTMKPAKIAGQSRGSRTSRKAPSRDAPRARAASSYSGPIESSRPRTVTAPARQADREAHSERNRDQHVEPREPEALLDRAAQGRVVRHRVVR